MKRIGITLNLFFILISTTFALEGSKKEFYYEDASDLNFALTAKGGDSVVIVFSDLVNGDVSVASWVDLISGDGGADNELSLEISDILSQRYKYVFPPVPPDVPEDIKKEYYEGLNNIDSSFKRATFTLKLKWTSKPGSFFRGSYRHSAGHIILKETIKGKVGSLDIFQKKGLLYLTVPIIEESLEMQIIQGSSKSIRELFVKNKWQQPKHLDTISVYKSAEVTE